MRVIAGTCRSMPLKTPPGEGTRPTTDRIKETLFNIIQNDVPGCVFVDLFCGSGGIGIEALSRGARNAYFAESDRKVVPVLQDNLTFTKMADKATVFQSDAAMSLSRIREDLIDIVYMDPPYGLGLEESVFSVLSRMDSVTEDTLIILETNLHTEYDYLQELGFEIVREKRYKTNRHLFIRRNEEQ